MLRAAAESPARVNRASAVLSRPVRILYRLRALVTTVNPRAAKRPPTSRKMRPRIPDRYGPATLRFRRVLVATECLKSADNGHHNRASTSSIHRSSSGQPNDWVSRRSSSAIDSPGLRSKCCPSAIALTISLLTGSTACQMTRITGFGARLRSKRRNPQVPGSSPGRGANQSNWLGWNSLFRLFDRLCLLLLRSP